MYDFQFAEVRNASIIDRLHGGAGNLRMRRVSRREAVQNRAPRGRPGALDGRASPSGLDALQALNLPCQE